MRPDLIPSVLACLALLPAVFSPVSAQIVSDSVPRDFVELFLPGLPGRGEAFVGAVPDGLRDLPLPEGRLVGTLSSGIMSAIMVEVAGVARDEVTRYEAVLAASGWTKAGPPPREGGFASGWPSQAEQWCSERRSLSTGVQTHRQRDYVRVWVVPRANSLCEAGALERRMSIPDRPQLPPLNHPDGVRAERRGGSGGGDQVSSVAALDTDLPLGVLLAHYGGQLEAAGWASLDETASASLAAGRYAYTDEDGQAWVGTLHLWVLKPGTVWAQLQLVTERRPW